mgnify:CR=1 FL=1
MDEGRNKIKVLMAKPGFDGHWRGATVVTVALRNAGMEVIYGGNLSPAEIVATAIQEDVDVVGLSILAAGHMKLISEVARLLQKEGKGDVLVVVGGTIPKPDIPEIKKMGVSEVFLPGTDLGVITSHIRDSVRARKGSA